ncbi:MAG: hypothetical protein JW715_16120 [Sedimentisphaerales bacterium]|nr:hypothetical protein [Sedimentisphaerales bacterium]
MTEQSRNNQGKTKRFKMRVRPVFTIVLALVFCLFLWKFYICQTAYEKLVAIEKSRAVDDSENAATIYNKLLERKLSLFEYDSQYAALEEPTLAKPWSGKDYPELVSWFEQRRDIVEDLFRASKIEKCRFPITDFPKGAGLHGQRLKAMEEWTLFLVRAANNDIADGRIEQALEKCFCLIRIGRHNRQQPFTLDFYRGLAIESLALQRMRICIVESDLTDENLEAAETAIMQSNDEWTRDFNNMLQVEKLYISTLRHIPTQSGWWYELKAWWQKKRDEKAKIDKLHEIYTRLLTDRRGNQVLIALRRFKNQNGRWPENLEAISLFADKNIFIDPQNNSPFIYKLEGDNFILYGKGPNNIDEGGTDKNGADDRAIWPLHISQTGRENAAMEQSAPERKKQNDN